MIVSRRIRYLACTAAAATALVVSASPASASGDYSGRAYVYGAGAFSDDWGDEGVLSTSRHASSNATCLWQKILWADGHLAWNDIDGIFGTKTRNATVAWQQDWGVSADGVVGKNTFGAADEWLSDISGNGAVDTYIGTDGTFNIGRNADGNYIFYDRQGDLRVAGYNYLTCG
ncbi:peptidoglycan-binding domain-containing protein [Streptomyces aculeolatus]